MGILRHVVLPLHCVPHGITIGVWLMGKTLSHPLLDDFPLAEGESRSELEWLLMSLICAWNGGMLFGVLTAIWDGHAYFVTTITTMELIIWTIKSINMFQVPQAANLPLVFAIICFIGMLFETFVEKKEHTTAKDLSKSKAG